MTAEKFAQIADIGLVALFITIIVACLLAAFIGYKRGIWSATFRLFFVGFLIILSIICLGPITDLVGRFPLDIFGYKSLTITNTDSGEFYNVTITNLHETLHESFKGYYLIFNMSSNASQASSFAIAMTNSVVKFTAFTVSMLFILIFGNLFATILWHCGFKHFIPKLMRKRVKGRWASMGQGLVVFIVSTFMFLAPFTSLVNTVNKAYKRNNQGASDGYIEYVDKFLNVYDNSLFAQVFFNWTTNGDDLTIDSAFMNQITGVTIDGTATSLIDAVYDVTSIASFFSGSVIDSDKTEIDLSVLLDEEMMKSLFASLRNSYVITYLLPIGVDFALTLKDAQEVIDPTLINVSDYDWKNELVNIENIYMQLLSSGLIEEIVEDEAYTETEDLIYALVSEEKYPRVREALRLIDNSKLLTRALEAVVSQTSNKNEDFAKYFPSAINELDDISWGWELSVVFDTLYKINKVDDRLIHAVFNYDSSSSSPDPSPMRASDPGEPELIELLLEHLSDYRQILLGDADENREPINVDSNGKTIVYSGGQKIEGRSYNLFDLTLAKYITAPLGEEIANAVEVTDKQLIIDTYSELFDGVWRFNLKDEFNKVFHTIEPFVGHYDTLKDIVDGNFPGTLEEFSDELINCLAGALPRADYSKLLSCVFYEKIEETVNNSESTFTDFGLDFGLIQAGVTEAKQSHTLGREIAPVILRIHDINDISDVVNDSTLSSEQMIEQIGSNLNLALARLLDTIYSSNIINYSTGNANKDVNFFNLMNYVFSEMNVEHVSFFNGSYADFRALTDGRRWVNSVDTDGSLILDGENGLFCLVIKSLAESHLIGALQDEHFFDNKENYVKLAKPVSEGGYNLPGVLDAVENSIVFKNTMGEFLDNQIEDVVDTEINVTFTNVTNWHDEGLVLRDLLLAIGQAPDLNLNSLDLTAVNDVVGLNNILHALVKSNIFVDNQNNYFRFGDWLYKKVQSSMKDFEIDNTNYDLVRDPEVWIPSRYGNQDGPDANYNILYHDFIYSAVDTRRTINSWINNGDFYNLPTFDVDSYIVPGTYDHYYENPQFAIDYETYLNCDELGAVVKTVQWASKAAAYNKLTDISAEVFSGLMRSINEANCLRIVVYNLFETAKDAFDDGSGNQFLDLSPAMTDYLIDCGANMYNFDTDRPLRQKEIDCLIDAYSLFKKAQELGVYVDNHFYAEEMTQTFTNETRQTFLELNQSNVFHKLGPATGESTVFQNSIISLLTKIDDVKTMIYSTNSPKDIYYTQVYEEGGEHLYSDATTKATYLTKSTFPYDSVHYEELEQTAQIDQFLEVIKSIIGGKRPDGTNYNGLTDESGDVTLDFTKVNWQLQKNVDAIKETLELMNGSSILVDAVPNSIKMAIDHYDNVISDNLPDGTTAYIKLSHANVYHNYFEKAGFNYVTNWNAKLTNDDFDVLSFLLQQVSLYENHSEECYIPEDMTSISDFQGQPIKIQRLNFLMCLLADSEMFHRSGRALTIDPTTGDVISANDSQFSFFQEVAIQIVATSDLKSIIYIADSPKDQYYGYTGVENKTFSIVSDVFGTNRSVAYTNEQIDRLTDLFAEASYFSSLDFADASNALSELDPTRTANVLACLNNSDLLYDGVPNALYTIFNNSISGLDGVDFTHGSPFFVYTYEGTVKQSESNYGRRYPQVEINNLRTLMTNYKVFYVELGDRGIAKLSAIRDVLNSHSLQNVLQSTYNSYVLHMCNEYKDNASERTVFEDCVRFLISESQIDKFIFDDNSHGYSNKTAYITSKIKAVSNLDFNPSQELVDGYHKVWFTVGAQIGEIEALLDFVKQGSDVLVSSMDENYDVANVQLDNIDPDTVRSLMYAINYSDVVCDALPVFVKTGFSGDMGISELATYGGTERTNYYLTQYQYGGTPTSTYNTEIDLIYNVLCDMQKLDSLNNFDGYVKFSNFKEFIDGNHSINNVMRFINTSKILNNAEWQIQLSDSSTVVNVYTRGLIMQKMLHSIDYGSDKHIDDLVIGSSIEDHIYALSEIFKFEHFNSDYESAGLKAIVDMSGDMTELASNFTQAKVGELYKYKDTILNLVELTYNPDGMSTSTNEHRSFFVSQLIGGILNDAIAQEETKINTNGVFPPLDDYARLVYGPSDIHHVVESAYNTTSIIDGVRYAAINATEKTGIDGALDIEGIIAGFQTLPIVKPTAATVRQAFAKMGSSYIAKVIYAAEIDNWIAQPMGGASDIRNTYYIHVYETSYNFTQYGIDFADRLVSLGLATE